MKIELRCTVSEVGGEGGDIYVELHPFAEGAPGRPPPIRVPVSLGQARLLGPKLYEPVQVTIEIADAKETP